MLLIIGQDSLIGSALANESTARGIHHACTSRRKGAVHRLDLSDPPELWQIPDATTSAILCASIPGITRCESDPEGTSRINVHAAITLARVLASRDIHFTFLSSNQVFAPEIEAPTEDHPVKPLTEYGRQKVAVEEYLEAHPARSTRVRLTKVVSPSLPLFAKWTAKLSHREKIQAFCNVSFSPLAASYVAAFLIDVTTSHEAKTIHLSAKDAISYHNAALWLAKQYGADPSLVESIDAPSPVSPASSRLSAADHNSCHFLTALTQLKIAFDSSGNHLKAFG